MRVPLAAKPFLWALPVMFDNRADPLVLLPPTQLVHACVYRPGSTGE